MSELTPATQVDPYLKKYGDVFWRLTCSAPGRLPTLRVDNPWWWVCVNTFMLSLFGAPIAWLVGRAEFAAILAALGMFSYLLLWTVVHKMPSRVQFGHLETFRGVCRALAGEVACVDRGFPLD